MDLRIKGIVLLWTIITCSSVAAAAPTSLTLTEVVARVLERNPQLQAAEFDAQAAAARIRQQQQTNPWSIGVDVENFAGSGRRQAFDAVEATLSLGRVLELGAKPRLRGAVARHEAGLLRHERDAQRLDLLAEAARRYLAVAEVQAQRTLAQEQVELLERLLRAVNQRIEVGKAPVAQRGRVRIDLERARLALEETEHWMRVARARLAALWGDFEPDFVRVQADLLRLQQEPTFAELEQRLAGNPALARLATAERLAAARLRLARAGARPDIEVRGGVQYFGDYDDAGFALSVRVPLGSAVRAEPSVEEARALAAREPLLAHDQRLQLRITLYELHQELIHSRDRLRALRERIVPVARNTVKEYSDGFRLGRYSLLELLEAQQSLLQAQRDVIDAAVEHHAHFIDIDRLLGARLSNGDNP